MITQKKTRKYGVAMKEYHSGPVSKKREVNMSQPKWKSKTSMCLPKIGCTKAQALQNSSGQEKSKSVCLPPLGPKLDSIRLKNIIHCNLEFSPSSPAKRTTEIRNRQRGNIVGDYKIKKTQGIMGITDGVSEMPNRTPEPAILKEFNQFVDGYAVVDDSHRRKSSYVPRYCWCTRCQIMYRMYKEGDRQLENWGNYPCFRL